MSSNASQLKSPLSLYIHWPFCASKCPYCDFNSHVRARIDESKWLEALCLEIRRAAYLTGGKESSYEVTSVFFGGGTPSLMPPSIAEAVISEIFDAWHTKTPEITLEGNPNSIDVERLSAFKSAGINRVSLGIQSFYDDALKFLGRTHNAAEAKKAIQTALSLFSEVSFDLIYARPEQTLKEWEKVLQEALSFGTNHLSLYQLTIEEGTKFHTLYHRGDLQLPPDQQAADFYDLTQEITEKAGLPFYEISNHARKGSECRHNLVYWRYQEYLGIGPGAHGRLMVNKQKNATVQTRSPEAWLSQALSHQDLEESPTTVFSPLSLEEQSLEQLMMGLRTTEGFFLSALPLPWKNLLSQDNLSYLMKKGQIAWNPQTTHLRATSEGLKRLNGVLSYMLSNQEAI